MVWNFARMYKDNKRYKRHIWKMEGDYACNNRRYREWR